VRESTAPPRRCELRRRGQSSRSCG
jgi:hypothetical protein